MSENPSRSPTSNPSEQEIIVRSHLHQYLSNNHIKESTSVMVFMHFAVFYALVSAFECCNRPVVSDIANLKPVIVECALLRSRQER